MSTFLSLSSRHFEIRFLFIMITGRIHAKESIRRSEEKSGESDVSLILYMCVFQGLNSLHHFHLLVVNISTQRNFSLAPFLPFVIN